jgi:hypothetical protein
MAEEDRVVYGGHWWKRDDGLILRYDEAADEWDLWEANLDGPLPPPAFLDETNDARPGTAPGALTERVIRPAAVVFVLSGLVWLVAEVGSVLPWGGGGPFGEGNNSWLMPLQIASRSAYVVWHLSLGAIVVATALIVTRYTRLRSLIDD